LVDGVVNGSLEKAKRKRKKKGNQQREELFVQIQQLLLWDQAPNITYHTCPLMENGQKFSKKRVPFKFNHIHIPLG